MTDFISVRQDGAVLRLAFNRPDKKNAITADMYGALADAMEAAERNDAVRAILFEAAGDMFTAGNDIADFMSGARIDGDPHQTPPVMRFLLALAKAEKPLVAAVQGGAVGVGVTMLLHCDLVYASENATFHTPFVNLALVPEAASSKLMPRVAGYQRAAEMLLLGKKIDATRATEFGFVTEVVGRDDVAQTGYDAAAAFASLAPEAVRLTKNLMKGDRTELVEQMRIESEHFSAQLASAEFREAGAAFMQKRKPDFSNLG